MAWRKQCRPSKNGLIQQVASVLVTSKLVVYWKFSIFWNNDTFEISVFFLAISPRSQMSSLAIFEKISTFFHKTLFFSAKMWTCKTSVVLTRKSKCSRFQNIKNYWNRSIIRDEILILVMESINFTWSRVEQRIWVVWASDHPYPLFYAWSCKINRPITKIKISSRIILRFQ